MKELDELKKQIESLILQIENLGQKGKAVKWQMQKIAYRNVLNIINKQKEEAFEL